MLQQATQPQLGLPGAQGGVPFPVAVDDDLGDAAVAHLAQQQPLFPSRTELGPAW